MAFNLAFINGTETIHIRKANIKLQSGLWIIFIMVLIGPRCSADISCYVIFGLCCNLVFGEWILAQRSWLSAELVPKFVPHRYSCLG